MQRILVLLFITIFSLPQITFAADEQQTILSLSATEHQKVEQDLLLVSLRYEAENSDSTKLQEDINSKINKALKRAKALQDTDIIAQHYSVYKHFSRKNGETKNSLWKGSQSLTIRGSQDQEILQVTKDLQKMGLVVSDIHYQVSRTKQEEVRSKMIDKAVSKLLDKAKIVAKSLGKQEVKVLHIKVNPDNYHNHTINLTSRNNKAKLEQLPVAHPAKTELAVTVSAKIRIID